MLKTKTTTLTADVACSKHGKRATGYTTLQIESSSAKSECARLDKQHTTARCAGGRRTFSMITHHTEFGRGCQPRTCSRRPALSGLAKPPDNALPRPETMSAFFLPVWAPTRLFSRLR